VARPTEWRRFIGEYVESASVLNLHAYQLPSIDFGETFTRLRFVWQAQHVAPGPGDGAGLAVAAGLMMVEAGQPITDFDGPATGPDQDWVWWEAGLYQSMLVSDTMGVTQELDVYPVGDCIRDCKAQRKALADGSDFWFVTENTTLAQTQTAHYLSITGSMLVLLEA